MIFLIILLFLIVSILGLCIGGNYKDIVNIKKDIESLNDKSVLNDTQLNDFITSINETIRNNKEAFKDAEIKELKETITKLKKGIK